MVAQQQIESILHEIYCHLGLQPKIKPILTIKSLGIKDKPNFEIKTEKKVPCSCLAASGVNRPMAGAASQRWGELD
jgi:hypothetical protein